MAPRLVLEVDTSVRGRVSASVLRRLRANVVRAARELGIPRERVPDLGVTLVDDTRMRALNLVAMGKDATTDVLAFPAADGPGGAPWGAGEVVLCWDEVLRQRGQGPGAALAEATVLCVHGLAHLVGHDHRTRVEGRVMHRAELRALRRLGVADIPRPYSSRTPGGR